MKRRGGTDRRVKPGGDEEYGTNRVPAAARNDDCHLNFQ
jgi:hypothetical protein